VRRMRRLEVDHQTPISPSSIERCFNERQRADEAATREEGRKVGSSGVWGAAG
jgi:hypothetical protein